MVFIAMNTLIIYLSMVLDIFPPTYVDRHPQPRGDMCNISSVVVLPGTGGGGGAVPALALGGCVTLSWATLCYTVLHCVTQITNV